MGRLDHLVEAVYERFKDRYFRDESPSIPLYLVEAISDLPCIGVLVDVDGTK
jgi:hypothetical protein